jgi:hypothetical protein
MATVCDVKILKTKWRELVKMAAARNVIIFKNGGKMSFHKRSV